MPIVGTVEDGDDVGGDHGAVVVGGAVVPVCPPEGEVTGGVPPDGTYVVVVVGATVTGDVGVVVPV